MMIPIDCKPHVFWGWLNHQPERHPSSEGMRVVVLLAEVYLDPNGRAAYLADGVQDRLHVAQNWVP